ncbi:D-alanyl-D-alanine carboxypeptidase family protein [Marivita sp.]|uniref:D-alanyl-D-alanine carboxypeptidase family protein n=1 Tax=Marivita sp. TaxID=2003365 RepID=UPI0025C5345D|nr:D-alanyl-D-alanine carboxypeptidase family protein [Marivita sp.]
MIRKYLAAGIAALMLATAPLAAFDTQASAAFVLDEKTGTVLLSKNADVPLPPASMSKLMTLYIAFEAVRDGRLSLDEALPVSAHANSFGGSTLFLRTGERVSVEELLRGIIVLSGNDACVVIAEALSPDGTEAGFAAMMTQRAQQMGMTNSTFKNSSGWPAEGHVMSVRDLTLLAQRIIEDFPDFYQMFAETEFLFDEAESSNRFNRNPLLTLGIGADGLKTGHTQEAGYGLVGSAKQGDRRVIFTITGLDAASTRAREAESIVNWAFRQFAEQTVTRAGDVIAQADVWMGARETVGLMADQDLTILLPNTPGREVTAEVAYTGPIEAPIAEGRQLAELIIRPDDLPEHRIPLYAAHAVPASGFVARMISVSQVLLGRMQAEDAM